MSPKVCNIAQNVMAGEVTCGFKNEAGDFGYTNR